MDEKEEKEKWYPGSYLKKAMRRRTVHDSKDRTFSSEDTEQTRLSVTDNIENNTNENNNTNNKDRFLIGKLKLTIQKINYLTIKCTEFTICVGGFKQQCSVANESDVLFDQDIDLYEITDDIIIYFKGAIDCDNSEVIGMCVITIANLLTITGKPKQVTTEWRQLLPVCSWMLPDKGSFKFISGYSDFNGFAMTRRKQSLGFLCLTTAVSLHQSIFGVYSAPYSRAEHLDPFEELLDEIVAENNVESSEAPNDAANRAPESLTVKAVLLHKLDLDRIQRCFKDPSFLRSVKNNVSAIMVSLLFIGLMCNAVEVWQLPILSYFLLIAVGLKMSSQRSFGHVIVWNDPGPVEINNELPIAFASLSMSVGSDLKQPSLVAGAVLCAAAHNTVWAKNAKLTHRMVRNLEKLWNLISFADPRVSLVGYIALLVPTVATMFLLRISPRMLPVVLLGLPVASWAGSQIINDIFAVKIGRVDSFGHAIVVKLRWMWESLSNIWDRVPDDLELVHRFIASHGIVNSKGQEMTDAAADYSSKT